MFAIGGLIFCLAVLRGSEADIRNALAWVRRSGVLIVVGAIFELGSQLGLEADSWAVLQNRDAYESVLRTGFGLSIMGKVVGGVVLGFGALPTLVYANHKSDFVLALQKRSSTGSSEPYLYQKDQTWRRSLLGSLLTCIVVSPLLAAHIFVGHTANEGVRWLTATVDIVHVVASAAWAGGLMMLVIVLWRRYRKGQDMRALQLAARFSVVASIAVALAGAAGIALAVTILDAPSDLWVTSWGRFLLAKLAIVSLAVSMGAYNHKILLPVMFNSEQNGELDKKFRTTATVEAAILVVVIILTAFLVAASS